VLEVIKGDDEKMTVSYESLMEGDGRRTRVMEG